MDINFSRNLGTVAPQMGQQAKQQRSKAETQSQAQFVGQNFLPQGGGFRPKGPASNKLSPSKLLSDLEPEEMAALGGGSALEDMAGAQPSLTVGEVSPLLGNPSALSTIADLMKERDDVKVSDFMSVDKQGKVRLDPSYKDPETMEFLKERPDISPSDLTAMKQNFTKKFKNPWLGRIASKKAMQLMKKRTDMMPEDSVELMNKIALAAGVGQKGAPGSDPAAAPAAALDMFESASEVLQKRDDLKPEQVGDLATSVGALGSPKDKQRSERVADGFKSATKSLEKNPMRQPGELQEMALVIGENFKGNDEKSAAFRMNAFKMSADLMGENGAMDAKSIGNFLREAKKDPKIKNAPPAKRAQLLAGAMDNMASGVKSGKVSANNLNQHFTNKKEAEDRGKVFKNQSKERQGISDNPDQQGKKSGKSANANGTQKNRSTDGQSAETPKNPVQPQSPGVNQNSAAERGRNSGQKSGNSGNGALQLNRGFQHQRGPGAESSAQEQRNDPGDLSRFGVAKPADTGAKPGGRIAGKKDRAPVGAGNAAGAPNGPGGAGPGGGGRQG